MTDVDISVENSAGGAAECRQFEIRGRVQGVFFRASTQTVARDLGLCGHAVNKPDGSVEVVACGGIEELDQLQRWLKHGPPMAEVQDLRVTRREYRDLDGFRTG